ncbi:putative anti-sigma factor antagonist BtrV [bioreactor metagenome]|uniref:Putative anti-sigma factor antagonist BtrV n=1 Tax=bioreactor metagenome TaxID=1076179 RepID=A0A644ZT59_9ZZZZ|nr:STAS domain-containing protein [Rikenellaceae bacterium]
MNISSQSSQGKVTIGIEGRIDTTNYNDFENSVNKILEENPAEVILDCNSLSYISSSGLRIFLTIHKRMMGTGGKLTLKSMQPAIKEIFDISGFSSIFNIE